MSINIMLFNTIYPIGITDIIEKISFLIIEKTLEKNSQTNP